MSDPRTRGVPAPRDPVEDAADREFAALLPGVLRGAAESFPAPGSDLAGRGRARGRRMRRFRNLRIGAAAVAVATLIGGGTYVVSGLGGRADVPPVSAASNGTSSPAPAANAESGAMTVEQLAAKLKSLLPPGGTTSDQFGRGTALEPGRPYRGGWVELLYRTDAGAAAIRVTFTKATAAPACAPASAGAYCAVTQPAGGTLVSTRGFRNSPGANGTRRATAEFVRPDGGSVLVDASAVGDAAGGSEPKLVVSAEQIAAIAQDPVWQPAAAYVAASWPADDNRPVGVDADGDAMLDLLRSRLAPGLTVSDGTRQPGYVSVLIDDGKGRSFLGVNVQEQASGSSGIACAPQATWCMPVTRPDGTRIDLMELPNDKEGTCRVWLAQAQRPGGPVVSVRLLDSAAESQASTRSYPVLNVEQLGDLAADPAWTTLPLVSTPGR